MKKRHLLLLAALSPLPALAACAPIPALNAPVQVGVVPAVPAVDLQAAYDQATLSQDLTTMWHAVVPALHAATPLAPLLSRETTSAALADACVQVQITSAGTATPVSLVFNKKSLYLEGFVRGATYWYFNDLTTCRGLFPVGTASQQLGFVSTHQDKTYVTTAGVISGIITGLSNTAPVAGQAALRDKIDQLSFLTSEAWRFSNVMNAVAAGTSVSKATYPEVNSWGAASAQINAAAPSTPAIGAALAQLTTRQTP